MTNYLMRFQATRAPAVLKGSVVPAVLKGSGVWERSQMAAGRSLALRTARSVEAFTGLSFTLYVQYCEFHAIPNCNTCEIDWHFRLVIDSY